jgi:hypothetical protein
VILLAVFQYVLDDSGDGEEEMGMNKEEKGEGCLFLRSRLVKVVFFARLLMLMNYAYTSFFFLYKCEISMIQAHAFSTRRERINMQAYFG